MSAPRRWRLKSGKQILAAAGLALCGSLFLRGQLEPWVQHTPSGRAIAALFRSVTMPGGTVPVLRPPAEARPALTAMIAAAPGDAALYRLRAHEAELALDFAAAEIDWKAYVDKASDPYAARIELADFYHRRLRSRDELAALTAAASAPDDPLQPATAQRGWHAFERMAKLIAERSAAGKRRRSGLPRVGGTLSKGAGRVAQADRPPFERRANSPRRKPRSPPMAATSTTSSSRCACAPLSRSSAARPPLPSPFTIARFNRSGRTRCVPPISSCLRSRGSFASSPDARAPRSRQTRRT